MGKSKAKKQRERRIREGKSNPEKNRGDWNGIIPITKKTPKKIEKVRKKAKKHKKRNLLEKHQDDSSFLNETGML
jgi:hypothetical protein